MEADMGVLFLAVSTSSAGDVERYRNEIPLFDKFNIASNLNHLSRNLVAQDKAGWRCCPAAHHVLVASANVCRHHLQDDAVLTFATDISRIDPWTVPQYQIRKRNVLNLYLAWSHVNDTAVACHCDSSLSK
jgi:hypothetical protein